MLHPTKNEDGDIEDVEAFDAFIHFASIFWKLIYFSACPPPHYAGGWACFMASLTCIGIATYVVGEFANLVGCTMGLRPSLTAITIVALGTSLPDTFASMTAAVQDKYADPALGNVTGSNAVNVFLGIGLPYLIAVIYESSGGETSFYPYTFENPGYYVEAGALGFSVIVFTALAVICIIFIIARRFVVKGELGGSDFGRKASCAFLCTLWLTYIVLGALQVYEKLGTFPDDVGGFDIDKVHRLPKCWSEKQVNLLKKATEAPNPKGGAPIKYTPYAVDPKTKKSKGGSLYDQRFAISVCINDILNKRRKDPKVKWPTDGSCGTFL